jgi:hypothetical protein
VLRVSLLLGLVYLISELLLTVTRRSRSRTGTTRFLFGSVFGAAEPWTESRVDKRQVTLNQLAVASGTSLRLIA